LASTYPAKTGDGTPSFVRDLAVGVARDAEVLVLVPAVPGGAATEESDGIHVRRYRFFVRRWEDVAHGALLENVKRRKSRLLQVPPLLIAQFFAVRRAVKEFKPDVIHAHWIIPQGWVARWAAPRVPTLVTTLGGDLYALNDPVSRAIKRSVVKRAAAITVMNEDMRAMAVALGVGAEKVTVRPMGARVDRFAHTAASRTYAKTNGPVELLAVGRLVEKKGFSILLDALRTIDPDTWRLTLVGDGPLRADLELHARGLPVTFAGQLGQDALAEADAAADIAVFPSVRAASGDQDGLPVALLEAMASGCAVIVSDLPGLNEAVLHDDSGLVVASGDVDALRASLVALIADAGLRERLGSAAASRARLYDVDAVAIDYGHLLAQVAGRTFS
jgi:glycosyltransferase involved in cell wall biosynthesis